MATRTDTRAARKAVQETLKQKDDRRFDLENRVFFRLYQASNLMHRTGTRAVSEHGATTQQWAVMGALSRGGVEPAGMSVKDMIKFLAVSRQSLTIVLGRLERLGLVEKVRLEGDGRIRRIRLTKKGRQTWTRMLLNVRNYYASALQEFCNDDAEQFFRLLDRLRRRLEVM